MTVFLSSVVPRVTIRLTVKKPGQCDSISVPRGTTRNNTVDGLKPGQYDSISVPRGPTRNNTVNGLKPGQYDSISF